MCRRSAERELRQAKARLAHFEDLADQIRADIAAFTRPASAADTGDDSVAHAEELRTAREAVARAGGILAFLTNSDDPVARELGALHGAVAPVLARQ